MEQNQFQVSPQSGEEILHHGRNEPPFISECEVHHEGGPEASQLFDDCRKNPGHPTFLPVNEFTIGHLKEEYRTPERMQSIKAWCNKTVRVVVKYTSTTRPDTFPNSTAPYPFCQFRGNSRKKRFGTGFLWTVSQLCMECIRVSGKKCPCHLCRDSKNPKTEYQQVYVATAAHVVFDDSEARHAVFEFFFDSEDRDSVKYVYGVKVLDRRKVGQRCNEDDVYVLCVTHDVQLFENMSIFEPPHQNPAPDWSFAIMISHPHGLSKRITIGNILRREVPVPCLGLTPRGWKRQKTWFQTVRKSDTSSKFIKYYISSKDIYECKILRNTFDIELEKELGLRESITITTQDENSDKTCWRIFKGLQVSIPTDATFFCKTDDCDEMWYTFPIGTRISAKKSKKSFSAQGAQFRFCSHRSHKIYRIDSCPGCSGAPVIRDFNAMDTLLGIIHSGSLKDGTNRSALQYSLVLGE